jgi:hypothetical protein
MKQVAKKKEKEQPILSFPEKPPLSPPTGEEMEKM